MKFSKNECKGRDQIRRWVETRVCKCNFDRYCSNLLPNLILKKFTCPLEHSKGMSYNCSTHCLIADYVHACVNITLLVVTIWLGGHEKVYIEFLDQQYIRIRNLLVKHKIVRGHLVTCFVNYSRYCLSFRFIFFFVFCANIIVLCLHTIQKIVSPTFFIFKTFCSLDSAKLQYQIK